MINLESARHLGLFADLAANTYDFIHTIVSRIKSHLAYLNLHSQRMIPMKYSVNSLLNTLMSYASLQTNLNSNNLIDCDKLLIQTIRKTYGLSHHDSPHSIFMDKQNLGFGIKSFFHSHILALARELEIIINSVSLD